MKKIVLAVLIFLLLLTPTFPSIPKVSATTTEDLWTTTSNQTSESEIFLKRTFA